MSTTVAPTINLISGNFDCLSVYDAGSINLDQWSMEAPMRDTIDTIKAAGWRLVTLCGRLEGDVYAIFYERVLVGYDDQCGMMGVVIAPDGSAFEAQPR